MPSNHISADLSPEAKAAALAALDTVQENLPFLLDLTADEIRALPKLGSKNRDFVERCLEIVKLNPNFLGRDFDVAEFERDVALLRDLMAIQIRLKSLVDLVDDTVIAVGSDAYDAALEAYRFARAAGNVEGVDELRAMMSTRFARRSSSTSAPSGR